MKVNIGNITVKNISFNQNAIEQGNYKLMPNISKKIGKVKENIYYLDLNYAVLSSEDAPFPFDISVTIEEQFGFSDFINESEVFKFINIQGIQNLFPYLRSLVTNVTSSALVNPIIMPLFGFKDIQDVQ